MATPIPEVKLIIEQYDCGICLQSQASQDIARQIKGLMNNPQRYQILKKNTILAAKELCWENEQTKIDRHLPALFVMKKELHIVCLDVPWPADYGGAIDMMNRIKMFHQAGHTDSPSLFQL